MKPQIRFSILAFFIFLISSSFIHAQPCEIPDNGTGTITLPPVGCNYMSPDEVWMIIDGLPPGTSIEFDGPLTNYICGSPLCSMSLSPGECEGVGGSLGGNFQCFEATLDFQVTGTGDLTGYARYISVPVSCEVHTGPRNPGDPVQTFPNDMFRLYGEILGDPDFCTFNITAGTDFGLPSPGQTILTDLGNGNFNVDSFFDITYQIEFEGCPGSVLDGYMGTTTATIRVETGEPASLNDIINPGHDLYTVPDDPPSFFEFGGPELPPIPAGFFGPGSDPFDGIITFGESIIWGWPDPEYYDVNIARITAGNVPPPYPSFTMIETEIVELRLQSVDPIPVNYQGAYTEFWDVEVQLSQIPSPTGYLDAIKESTDGGIFSYQPLMVQPQFIFTLTTNPSEVRIFDTGLEGVIPLEYHSDVNDYPYVHMYGEFILSATYPMPLFTSLYTCGLYLMPINDWGDALDPPYPTMASSNGAFHPIKDNAYLGFEIDPEAGGIPDPDALGDDNNNLADEDGVLFITPITLGSDADIEVVASTGGYLNAWFDFDINGNWTDPDDHVIIDQYLVAGINLLSFPVPSSATPGTSFARFRFSTDPNPISFDGAAINGEIEDYTIVIEGGGEEYDYGDAPDGPYPTLLASNGARHVVVPGIQLGNNLDAEPDGQPDLQALGDDLDLVYPPAYDDEDGVVFTSPLIQGQPVFMTISTPSPGLFLQVWIDFNQNGSWADAGEHIFIDHYIPNYFWPLGFLIPAGTPTGHTYMRFRYSGAQGLSWDGLAPDGEVEDYRIFIGGQTGDIRIDIDPTASHVQNEISMALVPGTQPGIPTALIAAYNDHPYPGGPGLGVSITTDGGSNWTAMQLPYPSNPQGIAYLDMFDPAATADGNGDLYVAHISTDYDWTNGPESGLYVHKTMDQGVTWLNPVQIAYDGKPLSSPDPSYRFNDRCQMIADVDPASPYYNNIYITWIKDRGWNMPSPLSDIYFSVSTDGGSNWSNNVTINQTIHNMGNMPNPAVASDGTVYVCWMDYNVQTGGIGTIYMNISNDGGVTWLTNDIFVRTVNLPPLNLNGGTDVLAKGAAVIDVSPTNPQEIYIVYAERIVGTPDEADIFFIRSPDAGNNWTAPLRVNDDLTTNDHVLPWIDVKPNGTIDVAFYGRYDDGDINWRVVMAISTDGGNSFNPNFQINSSAASSPFTPSGYWMGEYLGLVVDNTHAYVGFTSSITDINGDVFFAKAENPTIDIDFGDADDPTYPTMLANDGARHMLDGATFLGASVDVEPDGQPDGTATGDDNDGNNDDDGIVFNQIITGSPAQITATTSVAGYLQGWMDFNADGDWADPGEQIFTDEYIHFGWNVCLNYLVPVNANLGTTSARFRFSTVPGLSYTGLAPDGEVEDYEVEISEDPLIKWIQEPCIELPGLHAHDYVTPPDFYDYIVLADDWFCNGGLVTDIHWWGNYEALGGGINYFHLSIHDNDPTGSCLPQDPEIWGIDIPFTAVNETNTGLINSEGGIIFKYDYYLEVPFEQIEGNTYWLDICAYSNDPTDPAIWRWQESDRSTVPILCTAANMSSTSTWSSIIWNTPPPPRYTDMAFIITSDEFVEELDFGDADDPTYPTVFANDGARHMLDGVTFLGASVDVEPDGQPDGTATGDDNDGNNDDDGIIFNQILAGGPAQITATTSVAGYLQGWMDFNADGDWADPGEQIFTDEYIHFGWSVCLNYLVPVNANLGTTTARFRFSTVPGLSYTGLAPDGEVEDYEVEIVDITNIKWIQEPCEQLPGLHAHDYVTPPDFYDFIILADDWLCNGGLVTDIHWWGNYEALGGGINYFHLSIHDNDPTGSCLPQDPEIWGIDIPFTAVNETNTGLFNSEGGIIFKYDYYLEVPFEQIEGNTYWLDICAYSNDPTDPAIWRWQESDRSTVPILCTAATMSSTSSWTSIIWNTPPPPRYTDMAFIITSQELEDLDFGDADDPSYPTLLANDGARHIIDGITFMGASVDHEFNGQPHPNALGDDNDGNDDEDGVLFTSSLVQGQPATVDVDVSIDGYLNAWIDFNANGFWGDPGEQIAVDLALVNGNNPITYGVPLTATVGTTYARFRFSSATGLTFTGLAPDGEVEDYEVEIEEIPNKWAQYPDTLLPGLHAHDYDLQPSYGQIILADDWICEGGWVTDIHWWGNYELDPIGQEIRGAGIEYFHLSIHLLDTIAGCLPLDPEIWGADVPFTGLAELNTGLINLEGSPIYLYEYILDEPFPQIEGRHYWLDITAFCTDPLDPAYWRWQESGRSQTPVLCGAAEKTIPLPEIWNTISWTNNRFSDMAFVLTSEPIPEMDMGDASDPTYPTLLANNGAAHIIDATIYLGNSVDTEPDGQPDPMALGDDNDGNDDEDGVSLIFPLYVGGSGGFGVIASASGNFNCWIDYDANGSWAEADNHAIVDQPVNAGPNYMFFPIPANAVIGKTYARFRFSTAAGLSFTGIAPDGEVEDYEFLLEGEVDVSLKVFLEGPYTGSSMTTLLNSNGRIPYSQPYDSDPTAIWYYTGTESVSSIPGTSITDWVEVEFRDAPSAPLATPATTVNIQAAFLLSNGSIVGLDGVSPLKVYGIYQDNLYVVVWHRNHLGVLSANPLVPSGMNQYSYDFTTGPGQAYLNGQLDLGSGIYGMYGADGKPDGFIGGLDKAIWTSGAGTAGYKAADYNLDTQIDNKDKNDIWVPNIGEGTKVPN